MIEPLIRPDHARGGLLQAEDFQAAQDYLRRLQVLRCLSLHSWGIAFGLQATPAQDGGPAVSISPGMAVDAEGRQILLMQAARIDVGEAHGPTLYLSTGWATADADWRGTTRAQGYALCVDAPAFMVSEVQPEQDGRSIFLARLEFPPGGGSPAIDLSARRYGRLRVQTIRFPRSDQVDEGEPSIEVETAGGPLVVRSKLTDIFGSLLVQGRMGVGQTPTAAVDVRAPQPQPGAGLISSRQNIVYETSGADLGPLTSGDRIYVAPGVADTASQVLRISDVLGDQAVKVDPPPAQPFANLAYKTAPAMIARIRIADGQDALLVDQDGSIGLGGSPGSATLLTVRSGDVRLEQGAGVNFLGDGSVLARDDAYAFVVAGSGATGSTTVRSGGAITFVFGDPAAVETPPLIVTASGCVGVGVAAPTSTLTVNGMIRTSEGLIFPDKTSQTTAVAFMPIGSIVDWWRPDSSTPWEGEGFQLCDGSSITDPASPLVGQKTPDLREKFVRGVVSFDAIGSTGGADTHAHLVIEPAHTHSMNHYHPVTGATVGIDGTAGDRIAGSSISNSGHTHTINTTSSLADPAVTGQNSADSHQGSTDSASNIPPFMDFLKVVRIK